MTDKTKKKLKENIKEILEKWDDIQAADRQIPFILISDNPLTRTVLLILDAESTDNVQKITGIDKINRRLRKFDRSELGKPFINNKKNTNYCLGTIIPKDDKTLEFLIVKRKGLTKKELKEYLKHNREIKQLFTQAGAKWKIVKDNHSGIALFKSKSSGKTAEVLKEIQEVINELVRFLDHNSKSKPVNYEEKKDVLAKLTEYKLRLKEVILFLKNDRSMKDDDEKKMSDDEFKHFIDWRKNLKDPDEYRKELDIEFGEWDEIDNLKDKISAVMSKYSSDFKIDEISDKNAVLKDFEKADELLDDFNMLLSGLEEKLKEKSVSDEMQIKFEERKNWYNSYNYLDGKIEELKNSFSNGDKLEYYKKRIEMFVPVYKELVTLDNSLKVTSDNWGKITDKLNILSEMITKFDKCMSEISSQDKNIQEIIKQKELEKARSKWPTEDELDALLEKLGDKPPLPEINVVRMNENFRKIKNELLQAMKDNASLKKFLSVKLKPSDLMDKEDYKKKKLDYEINPDEAKEYVENFIKNKEKIETNPLVIKAKITSDEIFGIIDYLSNDYSGINRELRGSEIYQFIWPITKAIDGLEKFAAIKHEWNRKYENSNPESATIIETERKIGLNNWFPKEKFLESVFSSTRKLVEDMKVDTISKSVMTHDEILKFMNEDNNDKLEGSSEAPLWITVDKAFVSSSYKEGGAEGFDADVIYKIKKIDEGSGIKVTDLSPFEKECEVLFKPYTLFKIIKIEKKHTDGKMMYKFELEEFIPVNSDFTPLGSAKLKTADILRSVIGEEKIEQAEKWFEEKNELYEKVIKSDYEKEFKSIIACFDKIDNPIVIQAVYLRFADFLLFHKRINMTHPFARHILLDKNGVSKVDELSKKIVIYHNRLNEMRTEFLDKVEQVANSTLVRDIRKAIKLREKRKKLFNELVKRKEHIETELQKLALLTNPAIQELINEGVKIDSILVNFNTEYHSKFHEFYKIQGQEYRKLSLNMELEPVKKMTAEFNNINIEKLKDDINALVKKEIILLEERKAILLLNNRKELIEPLNKIISDFKTEIDTLSKFKGFERLNRLTKLNGKIKPALQKIDEKKKKFHEQNQQFKLINAKLFSEKYRKINKQFNELLFPNTDIIRSKLKIVSS